jgi:hypothetical protein
LLLVDLSSATIKVTQSYDQKMLSARKPTVELDKKLAAIMTTLKGNLTASSRAVKLAGKKSGENYMDSSKG